MLMMAVPFALAANENSYDFEVEGIYYCITNTDTVAVVAGVDLMDQNSPYEGEISIPATVVKDSDQYQVTEIAIHAFATSSVTKVEIPETVTKISMNAFKGCSRLETVSFPKGSGLKTIGDKAFEGCTSLSEFTIPSTVTSIGDEAFSGCSKLEKLTIPAGVTEGLFNALWGYNNTILFDENSPYDIESGVLYKNRTTIEGWLDRSVTEIEIRNGVTEIPTSFNAFSGVGSITSIKLPDSVKKIGLNAFSGLDITSIDLSHVTEIGMMAFYNNTELETVEWPENMLSLGQFAFSGCEALKNVEINGSVKEIPSNAFAGCSALETVVISESVESIGASAFSGISGDASDTTFIMQGTTPPTFDQNAFGTSKPESLTIIVPAGAEDTYAADSVLGSYLKDEDGNIKDDVSASISLPTTASVTAGSSITLIADATVPTGAALVWSSSNSGVAMVDQDGVVSGLSAGTATITASIQIGEAPVISAECVVTVNPYIPPVPSYLIQLPEVEGGTVTADRATARQGTEVTLTVTPDEGFALDSLTVTDFFGNAVEVVRNADGTYSFVMPYSQVEVSATFVRAEEPIVFTDVDADDYFYNAVYWAVENGITDGTSDTEFSPGRTVTRGEMVTFLWRAAGSPQPATSVNPFEDVSSSAYYYDAVLWAVENGITDGVSDTRFDPDGQCTRAQMVTFLWRAAGQPDAGTSNPFTDVDGEEYYYGAVLWASANGVTDGTSETEFSPDGECTRAQAVTFLYRAR